MRRPRLAPIALVFITAALAWAAGQMLFSTFMLYDDEGYVLFSLKNFNAHGGLYGEVYSQYGPLPYAFWWILHLLGMPLTHDAGRCLTLAIWTAAAAGGGLLVWRLTRDFAAAFLTVTAVFVHLWIMVNEPSHPGGLIALLLTAMACLGALWLEKDRTVAWAALAGAGAAALLLIKINVGGFAVISILAMAAFHYRNETVRRFGPWILAILFLLLPWALMRTLWTASWVRIYGTVFILAAWPTIGAARLGSSARLGRRELLAALAGGVSVVVATLGLTLARGTTPAELLDGMLLGPIRHPANFNLPFPWPSSFFWGTVGSFVLFILIRIMHAHQPGRAALIVSGLRLGVAVMFIVQFLQFPSYIAMNLVFAWSVPFLWLLLWPLPEETPNRQRTHTWLGFLFLLQWLHGYPVPGSQIVWGSFVALPLITLSAWEAARWLAPQLGKARALTAVAIRLALIVVSGVLGVRLYDIGARYTQNRALGLPGSSMVRLPDSPTSTYQLLCLNAAVHTDVLFSLPGMFSFNLWTDQPAPTLANVTHWWSILNPTQQQAIIDVLAAHPRAGVILQIPHLKFLEQRDLGVHGPLVDVIMRDYEKVFAIDGFEFRVRRGRTVVPMQTAEILRRADSIPASAERDSVLQMNLLLPLGAEVASVELSSIDDQGPPGQLLNNTNARIEITPINPAGHPIAPTTSPTFPFKLKGPTLVNVYFDRADRKFFFFKTLIVLRDSTGAEIALVRLRN